MTTASRNYMAGVKARLREQARSGGFSQNATVNRADFMLLLTDRDELEQALLDMTLDGQGA